MRSSACRRRALCELPQGTEAHNKVDQHDDVEEDTEPILDQRKQQPVHEVKADAQEKHDLVPLAGEVTDERDQPGNEQAEDERGNAQPTAPTQAQFLLEDGCESVDNLRHAQTEDEYAISPRNGVDGVDRRQGGDPEEP